MEEEGPRRLERKISRPSLYGYLCVLRFLFPSRDRVDIRVSVTFLWSVLCDRSHAVAINVHVIFLEIRIRERERVSPSLCRCCCYAEIIVLAVLARLRVVTCYNASLSCHVCYHAILRFRVRESGLNGVLDKDSERNVVDAWSKRRLSSVLAMHELSRSPVNIGRWAAVLTFFP